MSTPQSNEQRNGNDMAFPCLDTAYTPNGTVQVGLTKRELFAAMALQGMLADPDVGTDSPEKFPNWAKEMGKDAVVLADALLAALTEKQP